jgi:NTP pyrophosphatase (non-canonical NTP hydrolase)
MSDITVLMPNTANAQELSDAAHVHTPDGLCIKNRRGRLCPSGPLGALAKDIHQIAADHGFWEADRNFGEMIALAHSELSEALEEHRAGNPPLYYDAETGKPEGVAVELADCIIRCLDTLYSLRIDIDEVVAEKIAFNRSRPHKHGKGY